MAAKRIPQLDAISGASTANDDNLVIYDTSAGATKRILRSQLAEGLVGDLPYTPAGFIAATTVPTAIAEVASDLAASSGSSLIGYTQGGGSAVARTAQGKLREFVHVADFGASSTASAGANTAAIEAAMAATASEVRFDPVTYSVNPITVPSGTRLNLNGAVLQLAAGLPTFSPVLRLNVVTNVRVRGGTLDGNRTGNPSPTGAAGQDGGMHGVRIYSGAGHTFEDMVFRNCRTDGIYIGVTVTGDTPPSNLKFIRCTADNNYRQGCSVIVGSNMVFRDCAFTNTNGTAPQAGVDLEPNVAGEDISDVTFDNCRFTGNTGRGFTVFPRGGNCNGITVRDCVLTGNSGDFQLAISGTDDSVYRRTRIENCQISGRVFVGASSSNKTQHDVVFSQCRITNTAASAAIQLRDFLAESSVLITGCLVESQSDSTSVGTIDGARLLGVMDIADSRINASATNGVAILIGTATGMSFRVLGTVLRGTLRGLALVNTGTVAIVDGGTVIQDSSAFGVLAFGDSADTSVLVRNSNITGCGIGVQRSGAQAFAGVSNCYFSSNTTNTGLLNIVSELTGTGTPEGAVTAPIGSQFRRTDGGAGTSFYIKESGTGISGWVAK